MDTLQTRGPECGSVSLKSMVNAFLNILTKFTFSNRRAYINEITLLTRKMKCFPLIFNETFYTELRERRCTVIAANFHFSYKPFLCNHAFKKYFHNVPTNFNK